MRSRTGLIVVCLLSLTAGRAAAQGLVRAEALVSRAQDLVAAAVDRQDRAAKNSAKKQLEEAEGLLRAELKAQPACEKCHELLTASYYYRASIDAGKDQDDVLQSAAQGLARYPTNAMLLLFKGYASYVKQDFAGAAKALNQYLASPAASGDTAQQARAMLEESRRHFMSGWYNQRDFYASPESRFTRLNPQSYQSEIVLQVTPDYELSLGQQAFAALSSGAPAFSDPQVEGYLQQLVNRLTAQTNGPGFSYRLSILDSPEISAVTAPGHIIVYTGLLRFVENESELAAVLAHELAHNYGHHSARRLIKAYQAQSVAQAIGQAVNPKSQGAQLLTGLVTQLGVGLFLNAYNRFEETEADKYAAHLLFNAGYNPTALPALFLKMYKLQPKQPIKFLSTHPPMPDRVDATSDYLEAFPLDQELAIDSETFKQRIVTRFGQTPGDGRTRAPAPGAPDAWMGTFGPDTNDIQVRFEASGDGLRGVVTKAPASGVMKEGQEVFRSASRGGRVEGLWMTPPSALCPALQARPHPATLTFGAVGSLTMVINEAEVQTRDCVWGEQRLTNTYEWRRVR